MTEHRAFQLGDWRVQPQLNVIERGTQQVRVEPRYMDLLVHLSEHAGEVVSADEILSEVWTGLVVGEHSVYQGIARLRKALADKAAQPRYIETVAKRGYRLIEQPTPLANAGDPQAGADTTISDVPAAPPTALPQLRQRWRRQKPFAALAVLVTFLALAWAGSRILSAPDYDAVAVLGFANLGDSRDHRYFAEGLTTELISALGHLEHPNVLGQASSLRLDPTQHSSSEIGRILHVDAFVSGKVLRSGTDVRVFLEIVETGTGHQVWSATYDGDLSDLFKIQHRIAGEVAEAIQGRFGKASADQLGAPAPANLQAYDYYLLGQ
jgi:DNA-binding winged helix-turn-helix (wHTH) protein/TolB-like protein